MKFAIKTLLAAVLSAAAPTAWAQQGPVSPETYKQASEYEFGKSRKDLALIEEQIRNSKPDQYPAIEARLLAQLDAPETNKDARRYLCRYLGTVGSGKAVPALAKYLGDEQLSHPARMALEMIPDPAAAAALRGALGQVKGKELAGVIGSVGVRRDEKAVEALTKLAEDSSPEVSSAAIAALGQIGNADAARALEAMKGDAAHQPLVQRARITCAYRLAESGEGDAAAAIFKNILQSKSPDAQRIAAAVGLASVSDEAQATQQIARMLNSDDKGMQQAALAAFRNAKSPAIRSEVVNKLASLSAGGQLALLGVLNDFPKVSARRSVMALLNAAAEEPVQAAALDALAVHGDKSDVNMLVQKVATGSGAQKDAARRAVERLGKPGTDEALIAMLSNGEANQRKIVISILADRNAKSALPALTKLLKESDAGIAAESARALGKLGGTDELSALVAAMSSTSDPGLRNAVERAAGELCTRLADSQATSKVVLPALESAKSAPARLALIRLLPRVRGEQALAAAKQAAHDPASREAAIRALADWPDASAAPALFDIAKSSDNEKHAILAMQGANRLAGLREVPNDKRIEIYSQVLESAKRDEEKKRALAGLGDIASGRAVDLLARSAETPQLTGDAVQALSRLARQNNQQVRSRAVQALEKLREKPLNDDLRKQIDEALQGTARRQRN